jgi:hypothetical protein
MSFEPRVRIKLHEGCKGTGRRVKPIMQTADLKNDRFEFRAFVVAGVGGGAQRVPHWVVWEGAGQLRSA